MTTPIRNGSHTGAPRPPTVDTDLARGRPWLTQLAENAEHLARAEEIVANLSMFRADFFRKLLDPRRNIEDECGYPPLGSHVIDPNFYRDLYEREEIAARVVEVMPKECWQHQPTVFEDESTKKITDFEEAWDGLSKQLRGEQSWYQDEAGSPIWEYCQRADVLSGIGTFGIILLGFDDGRRLDEPVDGVAAVMVTNKDRFKAVRNAAGKVVNLRVGRRLTENQAAAVVPDSPIHANEVEAIRELREPKPVTTTNISAQRVERKMAPLNDGEVKLFNSWVAEAEARRRGEPWPPQPHPSQPSTVNRVNSQNPIAAGAGETAVPDLQRLGTDAQYFGVQFGPPETVADKPSSERRKLLFMRCFDESLVQIVRYEWNIKSPRFGQPVMYRVTLNDPRETHSGIGLPLATVFVHWSRVIHLADVEANAGSSEIFAAPRMRPVCNRLLDIRKIHAGAGEGYWATCVPGMQWSSHPALGGDVDFPQEQAQAAYENFRNGFQRFLWSTGGQWSNMQGQSPDPEPHINCKIESICIKLSMPIRVFKGSERGELASGQDDAKWNDRVKGRMNSYCTPRIIVPLVDRLIAAGVLPEPEGYSVEWPDLDSTTEADKAKIALTKVQAMGTFVSQQVETICPTQAFYVHFLGMDEETAESILDDAKKQEEDMMTMPAAGELGHPATAKPEPKPPVIAGGVGGVGGGGPPGAGKGAGGGAAPQAAGGGASSGNPPAAGGGKPPPNG